MKRQEATLSRREALALAAAATGALVAGCADSAPASASKHVIVVGAGLAGLGAAATLRAKGIDVTVVEARDRIGGRVHSVERYGTTIDLGASWIHDSRGNPLTAVAKSAGIATIPTDYDIHQLRTPSKAAVSRALVDKQIDTRDRIIDWLSTQADNNPNANLAPGLAREIAKQHQSGVSAQSLNWLLGVEMPLDIGAAPAQMTLEGFDEGDTWNGGPDLMIRGGAIQLVNKIAEGTKVQTGVEVTSISAGRSGVTVKTRSGSALTADGCVVAVPLGVLKASGIKFDPPLPSATRRAIGRVGFGLLNKAFLSYGAPWWAANTVQLGTVGSSIAETISVFPLSKLTGKPLAVGFTGGSYGAALERRGAGATAAAVTERMRLGFGNTGVPVESSQTDWLGEKFTRGSYSYLAPGSSASDRVALAKLSGRLILAGEHTSSNRPATMDGAWLAGQEAGRRLSRLLS